MTTERRIGAFVIVLAAAVFAALLMAVPALYPSFDEAKYLSIGHNVLAGRGVVSAYGPFLDHSPLWSVTLVVPETIAGIDPLAWGHLLNGISGVALILLVGAFGWRYRPAAGALAAAVMVGFTYLHDLTRTARLDVPEAMLTLLYVAVCLSAIRRDSLRWGVLAGLVFGLAFLVKEVALPYAPVPFLACLLSGRPFTAIGRVAGATLATALAATAWWFVVYASYTHLVYRLGLPAWTLIPLVAVVLALAGVGLASRRIVATDRAVALARAVSARSNRSLRARWRPAASAVLAIGWVIALAISFDQNPGLRGSSLFSLAQWRAYAAAWLTPVTVAAAAYCLGVGVALFAAVRRGLGDRWPAVGDLAMGAWCGIPLVLLVIGVGEPPRNYIAEIGIVIALASCGWTWLAGRVAAPSPSLHGAAIDPRLGSVARVLLSTLTGVALGFAVAFATRVVTIRLATVAGAATGAVIGLAWLGLQWRVRRRAAGAPGSTTDAPRGLRQRGSAAAAALLIATLVASSTVLADHVRSYGRSATGGAQAAAVRTVADWIETNVPPNTSIAFGSYLGYQMSISLDQPYRVNQIAQVIARFRANAPLGIGIYGKPPADDWVAVDAAPRNVAEFQAFQSSTIAARFGTTGAQYWIVNTGTSTSAPTILAAIDSDDGLTLVASWNFPYQRSGSAAPGYLHSFIYRVDAPTVSIDPGRLFIAPDALDGLVSQLETGPQADAGAIAARLLDRVVISPPGPGDAALLDRLRRLTGR